MEFMRALLQLIRMLTEEEISETLVSKLKSFLDYFMARATFISYLKRNRYFNLFTDRTTRVIETICGKDYSKDSNEIAKKDDVAAYRKIEKFRDQCNWKKIIFKDIMKDSSGAESFTGPSIVIMDNVRLLVFESGKEMRDYFKEGLGFAAPGMFLRLYQEDHNLIVLYATKLPEGFVIIKWDGELNVGGVILADFD